ncbi:MAG TPA: helicase C-terminal domain-containing protein [Dehalococcoidia bacterium]|nr:helicase C-terminal domain-containing protein [Dehalococcoidia bacterium]
MTTRYVAIDTETTGLDPENDEIIEVAAIAFDCEGVQDEFRTLVQPVHPPPYRVERLTGIHAAELMSAPHFAAVASEIAAFVGDSPVVGQNIEFDTTFLARSGVWVAGAQYDTHDLALLLLPGLHDYSLRGIADYLGIEFPVRHRAYADADATRSVFLALRSRLAELPGWLLDEVQRLAAAADWSLASLLSEVLAERPAGVEMVAGLASELLAAPEDVGKPLNGGGSASVQDAEVLDLLRRAGGLTHHFADFEQRPEQEKMARAVNHALTEGRHLLVEAGTGTGKSLAYLLPAALQAIRSGERVVVSTDTIGLQEQLIEKDLPVIRELLADVEPEPLRIASLKGRRNYLCLQRWSALRHSAPADKDEARLMARMLVWLRQTQTGDRAELNLHSSADPAWSRIAAENTPCLQTACPFVKNGTCFLYRARKRADAAHVLVVNHALLLSDIATGGHVLPPYQRLIIDEAHNLEDEATSRLAFSATEADFNDFLDRIGRRTGERASGLAGSINEASRGGAGDLLAPGAYMAGVSASLVTAATRVRARLSEPYKLLARVLVECRPDDREQGDGRLLVTRSTRVQRVWSDLEISASNLDTALSDLMALLDDVRGMLELGDQGLLEQDAIATEAADLCQIGAELQFGWTHALLEEDASLICWLERERNSGEVALKTAPLEVADVLRRELFEAKDSVILTSATLSADDRFDFLRERVGLDDADELLLGSPFDFEASTLIALPTDLPDPNSSDFVANVGELLVETLRASQGRALVLFTSYGALNGVYEAIKGPLEAEGILVLGHGTDGSPRQMLAALRENPRTVLLGTASFWEGVDVIGEALSLLVIARLPFAVPTDPIYQARSALYDEPFEQYAVPNAILRFRQGFGRLIRSKTDRGVLLVLDRRLRARAYGDTFLRSLPRCTLRDLASREIAGAVEEWLTPQA